MPWPAALIPASAFFIFFLLYHGDEKPMDVRYRQMSRRSEARCMEPRGIEKGM
jgi:hypothetical protein